MKLWSLSASIATPNSQTRWAKAPGVNYGTFVVTDQAKAAALTEHIRQMRERLGHEGVKAFMWQIDDIT